MFTKEQLAKWRSEGFIFDNLYDQLAVDDSKKSLTIQFSGCNQDDKFYYIDFIIKAMNLKSTNAIISVVEKEIINHEGAIPPSKVTINSNGNAKVVCKLSKDKSFSQSVLEGDLEFEATISCDGIAAKTPEFKLKCLSNKKSSSSSSTKDNICICKKENWTAEDLKFIITEIRKLDTRPVDRIERDSRGAPLWYDKNNNKIPSDDRWRQPKGGVKKVTYKYALPAYEDQAFDGNEIADRIFYQPPHDLNIPTKDANYEMLSNQLNKIFSKYSINTCLRKLNFLAQVYVETQKLSLTYEVAPSDNVHGGSFYRGRGLKQITHDYNYLNYYDFVKGTSFYKSYMMHRLNIPINKPQETVENFKARTGDKYITDDQLKDFKEFVPLLSKDIFHACNSAGWYWQKESINEYADKDDVFGVSAKVNNPNALNNKNSATIVGYDNRVKYHDILKLIFDENCE